jgi:arginine deiminase
MPSLEPTVTAEFDRMTDVLVHRPGIEMFFGLLNPCLNDYMGPFDRYEAKAEHDAFTRVLCGKGINVHYLSDLVLEGTMDDRGRAIEGRQLQALRDLASQTLTYCFEESCSGQTDSFEEERMRSILAMHPKDLFKVLMLRPTCRISGGNGDKQALPTVDRQGNLCYTRDPMIVTDKGVVLGRMKNSTRRFETEIMRYALSNLGIRPIYEVKEPGTLEGGDYIPLRDFALIGEGLRTNRHAIDQLLENRVFGFPHVVVVEDPFKQMEQMHRRCGQGLHT